MIGHVDTASFAAISMSSREIALFDFVAILIFQAAGIFRRSSHFRMAHSPAPQDLATFVISFHFGGALLILILQDWPNCPKCQWPTCHSLDFLSNARIFA